MIAVHTRYYGCAAHKTRGSAICQGTSAPRAETDRRLIQGLRDEVLAPAAIAKISARVKELLRDLQKRAGDQTDARDERIAALEGEIGRLTDAVAQMGLSAALQGEINRLADAIAQMGLSAALRTRLEAAEAELAELTAKATGRQTSPVACDGEQVGARIRKVALRLEQALATDVEVARRILGERLGDIRVEERDDGIYAQMDIGPVLLEAAGADVAGCGCGGKI